MVIADSYIIDDDTIIIFDLLNMLSGKKQQIKVLITGGTSGLGLELGKLLYHSDYEIYILGRTIKENSFGGLNIHFIRTDFSNLNDLRRVLYEMTDGKTEFDIIINNAGVLSPDVYTLTKDGFEYTYQVNFLSHLIINDLVLKTGSYKDGLKIISVTSPVYRTVKASFSIPSLEKYRSFRVYAESKLYLLVAGHYLKEKYPDKRFVVAGFNPGVFSSGISRSRGSLFRKLYSVAAPFMKSPGSVAKALAEVIRDGDYEEFLIYDSIHRFRCFPYDPIIRKRFLEMVNEVNGQLRSEGSPVNSIQV